MLPAVLLMRVVPWLVLLLCACQPPPFAEDLYLLPDTATCSHAGRDCQTHWLICAGACTHTAAGPLPDRALKLNEVCTAYAAGLRWHCADVRGETWDTAICADYQEGWCVWETECNPRPASCK